MDCHRPEEVREYDGLAQCDALDGIGEQEVNMIWGHTSKNRKKPRVLPDRNGLVLVPRQ